MREKKAANSHEKPNRSSNLLSLQFEIPLETKTVCAVQIRQKFIPLLECSVPLKIKIWSQFSIIKNQEMMFNVLTRKIKCDKIESGEWK